MCLRRKNPPRLKPNQQLTFPFYREPLSPSQIKQLPVMTDLEFFWGSPEQIDDDRYWFRAFKALPGKPYQEYFHLYTWTPIRSAMDLRKILADCVKESFKTRTHGSHGKIVIQCCPDRHWDPMQERCIEARPRFGKRPLFYKVLIPEDDLGRLLRVGKARRAKCRVRGIKTQVRYLTQRPFSSHQHNPDTNIKVICCACGVFIRGDETITDVMKISHGYCQPCRDKEMEKIRKFRETRKNPESDLQHLEENFEIDPTLEKLRQINVLKFQYGLKPQFNEWYLNAILEELADILHISSNIASVTTTYKKHYKVRIKLFTWDQLRVEVNHRNKTAIIDLFPAYGTKMDTRFQLTYHNAPFPGIKDYKVDPLEAWLYSGQLMLDHLIQQLKSIAKQFDTKPYQSRAEKLVEASRNIPDFGFSGELALGQTWAFTVSKNRDSDLKENSNFNVIRSDLVEKYPDDVEVVRAGHFLVSWVDQLAVRMLNNNGKVTLAGILILNWLDYLEEHPLADEDDYYNELRIIQITQIGQAIGVEHAEEVWGWINHNQPEILREEYISPEICQEAMVALDFRFLCPDCHNYHQTPEEARECCGLFCPSCGTRYSTLEEVEKCCE